jgi:HEPN domain-containing protein
MKELREQIIEIIEMNDSLVLFKAGKHHCILPEHYKELANEIISKLSEQPKSVDKVIAIDKMIELLYDNIEDTQQTGFEEYLEKLAKELYKIASTPPPTEQPELSYCRLYKKECMENYCSVTPYPESCNYLTNPPTEQEHPEPMGADKDLMAQFEKDHPEAKSFKPAYYMPYYAVWLEKKYLQSQTPDQSGEGVKERECEQCKIYGKELVQLRQYKKDMEETLYDPEKLSQLLGGL